MSKTSKSSPIVSLSAVGGAVHTSEDGKHTYLDVRFECALTDDEGVCGGSISIGSEAMHCVARLAQTEYIRIVILLAGQREKKLSD